MLFLRFEILTLKYCARELDFKLPFVDTHGIWSEWITHRIYIPICYIRVKMGCNRKNVLGGGFFVFVRYISTVGTTTTRPTAASIRKKDMSTQPIYFCYDEETLSLISSIQTYIILLLFMCCLSTISLLLSCLSLCLIWMICSIRMDKNTFAQYQNIDGHIRCDPFCAATTAKKNIQPTNTNLCIVSTCVRVTYIYKYVVRVIIIAKNFLRLYVYNTHFNNAF